METHKLSVRDNLLKLATRIDLIAEEADIIKNMPELISKEELVKELMLLNTLLEEFYVEYNKIYHCLGIAFRKWSYYSPYFLPSFGDKKKHPETR